ncbi:MAG: 1-(5-phosphoribosyl)-5-[(5-phosphoribosylamino)methylideneamino]imidazole-4-carboxamide isomerase [Prevotellaceae bacterium]|nr:1-(5-phosphoribosyl)-5-[(5-phosphoribosylamino)methylideneamino]imidazole-4-carboxamide isomerase [Prevotellaceae bacterium]
MMRLIPAIDIIDGKCVRLTKGDYATKKIYNENPLEVAKKFEDAGIMFLHLVDLDGAKSNHIVNHKVLEQIAFRTSLKVDFGGGLKSDQDLKTAFECGANQITAGSIAVKNPEIFLKWLAEYGAEKIILGADAIDRKISTHGWTQNSSIDVTDFIKLHQTNGIKYVICTDIGKDGMLQGVATELYRDILSNTPVNLIASGGVSCIDDIIALQNIGCEGVIIGKALYEGQIEIEDLKYMKQL